jgi:hypothetical protein
MSTHRAAPFAIAEARHPFVVPVVRDQRTSNQSAVAAAHASSHDTARPTCAQHDRTAPLTFAISELVSMSRQRLRNVSSEAIFGGPQFLLNNASTELGGRQQRDAGGRTPLSP